MKANAKLKTLVTAVALVAAGAANAAIDAPATGNGELFLTVWDSTLGNEASFNFGLNTNVNSFNGNGSYSFTNIFANPVFTSFFDAGNFSTQANWKWNVTAASFIPDNDKLMFTSVAAPVTMNDNAVFSSVTSTTGYQAALGACDSCGTNVPAATSYAGTNYANNFNGTAPTINNAGSLGQSLFFFQAFNNMETSGNFDPADPATLTQYAYTWNLGTDGTLNYNSVSAPVPLPAAVWLLGSALVGLVGVARRRNESQTDTSDAALPA